MKSYLSKIDLNIVPLPLNNKRKELEKLIDQANPLDCIYLVDRDKLVVDHLRMISAFCIRQKIPLIGGGCYGAKIGTIAAITFDSYKVGRNMGKIINALYQGATPGKVEIMRLKTDLYLNINMANCFGIRLPQEIKKEAVKIFN